MNNGRVNLFGGENAPSSLAGTPSGLTYQTETEVQFHQDMLRGNWEQNDLSKTFFSQTNMKIIQTALRKEVYEKSQPKGYVIDDQSTHEMKMIMRAIYYQYARNSPNDIQGQIEDLNRRVLNWSVPHVLSAVEHHMYYLKDINTLPIRPTSAVQALAQCRLALLCSCGSRSNLFGLLRRHIYLAHGVARSSRPNLRHLLPPCLKVL